MFIKIFLFTSLLCGLVPMAQAITADKPSRTYFEVEGAKKYIQSDDFKKVEKEIREDLKKVPREKHYFLYLIAAKHCLEFSLFDKAREYLELALLETTAEDKSQIYIKLLQIDFRNGSKVSAKANLDKFKKYLALSKNFESAENTKDIHFYEEWTNLKAL